MRLAKRPSVGERKKNIVYTKPNRGISVGYAYHKRAALFPLDRAKINAAKVTYAVRISRVYLHDDDDG